MVLTSLFPSAAPGNTEISSPMFAILLSGHCERVGNMEKNVMGLAQNCRKQR